MNGIIILKMRTQMGNGKIETYSKILKILYMLNALIVDAYLRKIILDPMLPRDAQSVKLSIVRSIKLKKRKNAEQKRRNNE